MKVIDSYIENGVKITVLEGTKFVPKPKRSVVEEPKDHFANSYQLSKLLQWCNSGNCKMPRRTTLSELSGIPLKRIRGYISPSRQIKLRLFDYKLLMSLRDQVEQLERENNIVCERSQVQL